MENRQGERVRREFVLLTNIVRYAGEQPCEAPAPFEPMKAPTPLKTAPEPETPTPAPSFFQRMKGRVRGWFGK
jgi:hypothetical protein